jgi:hypothetical protein
MCNLYTLAPWEVRHLVQHYRLIGRDFELEIAGNLNVGGTVHYYDAVAIEQEQ